MKRDNWVVEEYGIRPAGPPDHCFYCGEPLGHTHDEECVIRSRTVVVKVSAEVVITVPEFFTREQVDKAYERNRMVVGLDYLIEQLRERREYVLATVSIGYMREATTEDEEIGQLFVKELPS